MANILRNNIGSVLSVTGGNALANNQYSVAADKLVIDNTTNKALLFDVTLSLTCATAPVTGSIALYMVDYDLTATTAGAPPTTTLLGKYIGTFSPAPAASNSVVTMLLSINALALTDKADLYIQNAGTGVSINTGWVLSAQCWSPG